jgi:hypothetical protein
MRQMAVPFPALVHAEPTDVAKFVDGADCGQ